MAPFIAVAGLALILSAADRRAGGWIATLDAGALFLGLTVLGACLGRWLTPGARPFFLAGLLLNACVVSSAGAVTGEGAYLFLLGLLFAGLHAARKKALPRLAAALASLILLFVLARAVAPSGPVPPAFDLGDFIAAAWRNVNHQFDFLGRRTYFQTESWPRAASFAAAFGLLLMSASGTLVRAEAERGEFFATLAGGWLFLTTAVWLGGDPRHALPLYPFFLFWIFRAAARVVDDRREPTVFGMAAALSLFSNAGPIAKIFLP